MYRQQGAWVKYRCLTVAECWASPHWDHKCFDHFKKGDFVRKKKSPTLMLLMCVYSISSFPDRCCIVGVEVPWCSGCRLAISLRLRAVGRSGGATATGGLRHVSADDLVHCGKERKIYFFFWHVFIMRKIANDNIVLYKFQGKRLLWVHDKLTPSQSRLLWSVVFPQAWWLLANHIRHKMEIETILPLFYCYTDNFNVLFKIATLPFE